jgi:hypothetical protein
MREEHPSRTSFFRGMSMAVDGWMRKSSVASRSASGGDDFLDEASARRVIRTLEHGRNVAEVAQ